MTASHLYTGVVHGAPLPKPDTWARLFRDADGLHLTLPAHKPDEPVYAFCIKLAAS